MTLGTAGYSLNGSGSTVAPALSAEPVTVSPIRRILFLLPVLVLGAGIGSIVGIIVVGDPLYTVATAAAVPLTIFIALAVAGRGGAAVPTGIALARIESIQRTGLLVDGLSECVIRLVVQPSAGAAYQTMSKQALTDEQLRSVTPGAVIAVTRLGAYRPDVAVIAAPSAEWMARIEAVRRDPSLIPSASSAPLWSAGKPPQTGSTGGRVVRRSIGIAVLIAGAALALVPAYGSIDRAAESLVAGDLGGTSMVTGNYQQLAVDELAAAVGSYQFSDVRFYDSYVIATAATTEGATTADQFTWRFGRVYSQEPELIQPADLQSELFDASTLDFSMVAVVTKEAMAASGITSFESVYPGVSLPTTGEGAPVITVYLSSDYESLTYVYDFEGTLLTTN